MTNPLRSSPSGPLGGFVTSDRVTNLSDVSGETVTEALETLRVIDRSLRYEIYEDFDYVCATNFPAVPPAVGTTEDLMHFRSNWAAVSNSGTGLILLLPGIAGHPGVIRLETQAFINRITRMYGAGPGWAVGAAGSQGSPVNYDDIEKLTWIARVPTTTLGGFLLSAAQTINRLETVEFTLDTNVSAQLQMNTTSGGASQQTLITMPSDGDFHKYEIELGATAVRYSLDESVVAEHTTGIPTNQPLNPYVFALSRSAAIRQLDLDLFWLLGRELAR